jgi:predicted phage-related endonuclease
LYNITLLQQIGLKAYCITVQHQKREPPSRAGAASVAPGPAEIAETEGNDGTDGTAQTIKGTNPYTKEETTMGQNELLATVRNLKDLMNMKAELEAEIEAAQDTIKSEMAAREVDELTVDVFKVRWTEVISNRFDTTAFKKAHEDICNIFTKASETRRFSIA